MSEARAKYIREMSPIKGGKNTGHLEIMETQIEKLIHDTKKNIANWVTVEYSMKQKENELEIELEKMKDLLASVSKKNKKTELLLSLRKEQIETIDTKYEKKIEALDSTFETIKKSKSTDNTKRNGWYDANLMCTTQIISIEKTIDTKQVEITSLLEIEITKFKKKTRIELKKLFKTARVYRKTITKLVTKRNTIYLRNKTVEQAHILRFLNKSIKKYKKKVVRLFTQIEKK